MVSIGVICCLSLAASVTLVATTNKLPVATAACALYDCSNPPPATGMMRERKCGQIALFSSLAGYFGLPVTPSYCASKAAIKAYGEALRGGAAVDGVEVNVVMPGFVESLMCDEMPGAKPMLWTAEKAARFIRRGLERNHARISFPFPLNLGCWYLSVAPASIAQRLVKIFGFGG